MRREVSVRSPRQGPSWGFKAVGALFATVLGFVAVYADIFNKVHEASCRGFAIIGMSVGWLACPSPADTAQVQKIGEGVNRIERKLDDIHRGSDAEVVARQKIKAEGYNLDNAGYIKALAREGGALSDHFKVLGVAGDEASLRQALLAYPVTSNEYLQLGFFMGQAHSEHYASRVRPEIVDLFKQAETTLSTARLREAACSSKSTAFLDSFVRKNLASACDDDGRWMRKVAEFATKALHPLNAVDSYIWWMTFAEEKIAFTPKNIPLPANPRTLALADLVKMTQWQQLTGDYVQANVTVSLFDSSAGTVIYVFDPATGYPVVSLTYVNAALKDQPCWSTQQSWQAKCTARLVLHADAKRGLRVLAVENMRPLTGRANAPSPAVKR